MESFIQGGGAHPSVRRPFAWLPCSPGERGCEERAHMSHGWTRGAVGDVLERFFLVSILLPQHSTPRGPLLGLALFEVVNDPFAAAKFMGRSWFVQWRQRTQ